MQAQTTPDAAILSAADQMNLIDWYREATNGTYGYNNAGNDVPDTFFDDIPFYNVNNYSAYQGTYRGKTWNRTGNKYGDTWLTLGNVDYEAQTMCVKAGWFNGLVGDVHLESSFNYSNILTGEGQLYYQGEAVYTIQIFIFLFGDRRSMKGACVLFPLRNDGYMQCSTFTLRK